MPFYQLKNKETEETIEVFMSFAALETYLTENPHLERDWSGYSTSKPHSGDVRHKFEKNGPAPKFNEMLKGMAKYHKGSTIQTW